MAYIQIKEQEFDPIKAILRGKRLKGVAEITLTDVHTGKEEKSVDENMVTNAISDLFLNNITGIADYTKLMPIRKLFGGCLLFRNNLTENANSYIPPDQGTNPLIANAGDEAHSTADPRRGNPNSMESQVNNTSIKHVWSWDTGVGLGKINAVALCPAVLGNMGLVPFSSSYTPYQPINVSCIESSVGGSWTRDIAKKHPVIINPSQNKVVALFMDGDKLVEITSFHDTTTLGVSRAPMDFTESSARTTAAFPVVSNLNWSWKNNVIFVTESYYYVVKPVNAKNLAVFKVDRSDMSVTVQVKTSETDIFYTGGGVHELFTAAPAFPNTEDAFFWPNEAQSAFLSIKFSDLTDAGYTGSFGTAPQYKMQPVRVSDKLIIGSHYFINNKTIYPIAAPEIPNGGFGSTNYAWTNVVYKTTCAGFGYYYSSGGQNNLIMASHNLFMTTINNLAEEKEHTADKVMKLAYTITEA